MARPDRAAEIRASRRMKPGDLVQTGMKLMVDSEKLDRDNYEYRWVNDKPGRVERFYRQDWDVVRDETVKEDGNGVGTLASVHAGVHEGGPMNAILMRKHRVLADDDRAARRRALDEIDNAIRGGTINESHAEGLKGAGVYTPNGVNTLER